MRKYFIIFLLLISVLIVSGCTTTTTTTPTPAPIPVAPVTPPTVTNITNINTNNTNTNTNTSNTNTNVESPNPHIVDVAMQGFEFKPATTTISAGDTIRWTNLDSANHDVKGNDFNSGVMTPNAIYEFTFTQQGTYSYMCTIHPSMQGIIIVV